MIRDLDVTCEHLPDADCPYRDLRAFQEQDAPVLFGRDAFTRDPGASRARLGCGPAEGK